MSELYYRFLSKLYEPCYLSQGSNFTGVDISTFQKKTGSRMQLAVSIHQLSGGATLNVTLENAATLTDPVFEERLNKNYTATGIDTNIILDLNRFCVLTITVSGGTATYSVVATLVDNASSEDFATETTLQEIAEDVDTLAGTVVAGRVQVDAELSGSDIEIGAVEIKDADSDTRVTVKSDGVDNAIVVTQNSQPLPTGAATEATLSQIEANTDDIEPKLDTIHADLLVVQGKQDTGNASLASIDSDIDVALSTRASEATLAAAKADLDTLASTVVGGRVQVDAELSVSDIEIGAVELKDADTDTRVKVKSDGVDNAVVVTQNSQPLPTGAATEAKQDVGNASLDSIDANIDTPLSTRASEATLASIDAGIPAALGQTTMANSMPVAIASDQTPVPISENDDFDIRNITGTVSLPTGAATEAKQDVGNASLASIDSDIDVSLSTRASEATLSALNSKINNDYGAPAGAVRTAAQVGNAIGAADFDAGATSGQTLRTASNLHDSAGNGIDSTSIDSKQRLDVNAPTSGVPGVAIPFHAELMGGKDPDGNLQAVATDEEGRLIVSALTGFNANFSFGDVATASAANTVPVRRTAYTEQTTNAQRSVLSSSANDTAAGTGARTIEIIYYTATGTGPFTETITLNGVAPVNTVNTDICFIEKIQVVTVGSGTANAGTISLRAATGGGGATIGTIAIGNNQTFWAHHYVADTKICNITGVSVGNDSTAVGNGALFTLRAIPIGVANAVEKQISDFITLFGQSSVATRAYLSPIKVTGPAKITAYVLPNNNTAQTQRISFDFFEP